MKTMDQMKRLSLVTKPGNRIMFAKCTNLILIILPTIRPEWYGTYQICFLPDNQSNVLLHIGSLIESCVSC